MLEPSGDLMDYFILWKRREAKRREEVTGGYKKFTRIERNRERERERVIWWIG